MKNFPHLVCCLYVLFCSDLTAQTNIDFESTPPGIYTTANAVSGWTISSQTNNSCTPPASWTPGSAEFSVVSTPLLSFPLIGNIPNSPLGGTTVVQLNNTTPNSSVTKMSTSFSVTTSNTLLDFAFAGIWEDEGGPCCEHPGFSIKLLDALGNPLSCLTYSYAGAGCNNTSATFSITSGAAWTNWQVKYVDLTSFIGTIITLEITTNDCIYNTHYGTLLFDAKVIPPIPCLICDPWIGISATPNIHFCPGSSVATIDAPLGYVHYFWEAPVSSPITAAQSTLSSLTVTNPVAGNVYTLIVQSLSGCSFNSTYTLVSTMVSISALETNSTCAGGGSSGSSTVIVSGSASGYNYSWVNSASSVVASTSVASGLGAGTYSVFITAAGSQSSSCGTAMATVTINTAAPTLFNLLKPYCGNEAYLNAPGGSAGSNYQWYDNLSAISSSLGGTSASITVSSPVSSIYYLSYLSSFGCKDSVKYNLMSVQPGSLTVTSPVICTGATNGTALLSMLPAAASSPGLNSYSVFSTGTTSAYSSSLATTSATLFTALNLSAGGVYSVNAFDGLCKYATTFTVPALSFDYTVSPATSPTICAGNNLLAHINFSTQPGTGNYTYTWTPTTFLFGSNTQNTIISPTVSPGSVTSIVYTVVVTPTLANCPLTKTLAVTAVNLLTPTINLVPALCANAPLYSLSAIPVGGTFYGNSGIAGGAQISAQTSSIGTNTFSYSTSMGTCVATSVSSYTVNALPQLSVSGNTAVCNGQSTTLLAGGASTYSWNTMSGGPVLSVTPITSTSYTVTGTDVFTNCSNTKTLTVTVFPNPTLTVTGDTLLCSGETTTLLASGADSYNWWGTGILNAQIVLSPASNTSYTLSGVASAGSCSDEKVIMISVSPCTGIEEKANAEELKIYPNPTRGQFFIETTTKVTLLLSDALGRIILEQTFDTGTCTFDLSHFPDGIYILKIFNGKKTNVRKLVKQDN